MLQAYLASHKPARVVMDLAPLQFAESYFGIQILSESFVFVTFPV